MEKFWGLNKQMEIKAGLQNNTEKYAF